MIKIIISFTIIWPNSLEIGQKTRTGRADQKNIKYLAKFQFTIKTNQTAFNIIETIQMLLNIFLI